MGRCLIARCERPSPGSHLLAQDHAEPPQPDQPGDQVLRKCTLREHTQFYWLAKSMHQEAKVGIYTNPLKD